MRDPERLLERGDHALDVELLSAGREDLPPRDALDRTLARIGVAGAGIAVATVASTAGVSTAAAGTTAASTTAGSVAGGTAAGTGLVAATGKVGLFSGMSLFGKVASVAVAVSTFTATSVVVMEDPVTLPVAQRAVENGSALSTRNTQELATRAPVDSPAVGGLSGNDTTIPDGNAPSRGEPAPAPQPTLAQPAIPQPTVAQPAIAQPTVAQPASTPPASTPPASTPRTSEAPGSSTLNEELKLLDRARQALLADRPAECVALLNDYRTRFPKGHLRVEAGQLRVKALTANGDASQAEREAQKLAPTR